MALSTRAAAVTAERYAIDWAAYDEQAEEATIQFRKITCEQEDVEDRPATPKQAAHKALANVAVTYGGGRRITFPVKRPKDIDKLIDEVLRGDYPI